MIIYLDSFRATNIDLRWALVVTYIVFIINNIVLVKIFKNNQNNMNTSKLIINAFIFWLAGLVLSELMLFNYSIYNNNTGGNLMGFFSFVSTLVNTVLFVLAIIISKIYINYRERKLNEETQDK